MKIECNIVTQGGQVTELFLEGSAGATKIDIVDNASSVVLASYAGRYGEQSWQFITPQFMKAWIASGQDLYLRIDCLRTTKNLQHIISSIELDVNEFSISSNAEEQLPFYDVNAPAINEEMLAASVNENAFAVSKAAEDNSGWPIVYYQAKILTNINVLNTCELKAIQGSDAVKTIKAFFPHQKILSTLEFDQFGLKYNDITDLHILAETFHKTYNDPFARPSSSDIVYIKFLDQYFEVTDIEDIKTNTNKILYYDVKLQFITDRMRVAKDSDVLDLSNLINTTDYEAQLDAKAQSKPEITEFDKRTWSMQVLQYVEQYDATQVGDNFVYGICHNEDLGWCKFFVKDDVIDYYALADNEYNVLRTDDAKVLNVCKLAMFDKELSKFDATMYYTSYTFPRTLRPLQLIEHQIAKL